ncbi:MAG TPA: EamA family transporter [Symbiobacteriaceae bacterium]|jgi:drug/metabolite transporter (DMT)-like permease|nr:EamA family transporter [Symbiobacteriaceae bacterium]
MGVKQVGALLFLSALWGGSFLFIRIAAPALGPIVLIEVRVLLAGLALLGYAYVTGNLPALRQYWRQYLAIGAINSAIPFVLISTAELHLPASLAATLNATTPLFGALVAALWLGEALTVRKVVGLLAGFAGVAVLVGLGPLELNRTALWSVGASLLAAIFYGVGAVYTKVKMPGGEPQGLALYSQLASAVVLLPVAPFALPAAWPSTTVVASVLTLALLCTALAYRIYFYLIVNVGPTRATMVTYLSPAFGMLWGALFLHESLGAGFLLGFPLILGSVALVSGGGSKAKAVQVDG